MHSLCWVRVFPTANPSFKNVGILRHCVQSLFCHIRERTVLLTHTCLSPVSLLVMCVMLMQAWEHHDIRDILLSWDYRYTLIAHDHMSGAKDWEVQIVRLYAKVEQWCHSHILIEQSSFGYTWENSPLGKVQSRQSFKTSALFVKERQ
jgi:hypothetical protein